MYKLYPLRYKVIRYGKLNLEYHPIRYASYCQYFYETWDSCVLLGPVNLAASIQLWMPLPRSVSWEKYTSVITFSSSNSRAC